MGRKAVVGFLGMAALLGSSTFGARAANADDLASARAAANQAAQAESQAESTLGRLSQQINTLQAKKSNAEARMAALRDSIRQIAIQRYINAGNQDIVSLEADVNAQARADALSQFALRGNQDAIDEYTAAVDDLDAASKALAARKASARTALATLQKRQADVQTQLKRLEQLDAKRKDAAAVAARTAKATRVAPTGPIATGPWVCPVQGPHAFSDDFGAPRAGGRSHQGNDIFAPRGTPAVAPVSGTVVDKDNSLGGHAFQLSGDDGTWYYGAHLDSYSSNTGHVQAGTILGYVGNTGDASGGATHLHFEIHPNHGGAVDPYPTLRKYC